MMRHLYILLLTIVLAGCTTSPENAKKTADQVPMYPDYTDITIPENIAPLNFLLRSEASRVCVYINNVEFYNGSGPEVTFDLDDWHELLAENAGKRLEVNVYALYDDGWTEYPSFAWTVSKDRVDPYLTYRLIEPDYEVFNDLVLQERCVENFETRNFSDYHIVGNRCMNCHTYASQDPQTSMMYVRGEGGGAILNINGVLQKLNLKRDSWASGSVYFGFSPSKKHIVFSTNKIIPAFHSLGSKRLEVFDTESDVYAADIVSGQFIESPLLADSTKLETFPTFSPDGKYIYYCSADMIDSLAQLKDLRYSLLRIPFDEATGTIGDHPEVVYDGQKEGHSVCHPRISPDGRFLVFTIADYGTFPIWHQEADLAIMKLDKEPDNSTNDNTTPSKTNKEETASCQLSDCQILNSSYSETYHSWSSNSRWLVFASKRDDGLYGKPYYAHVDANGVCSKPFVLPQQHPTYYDNCLKSFNAPEQGRGPLPFDTHDVANALRSEAREFK